MGVHPKRWSMEPAGNEVGRHRRRRKRAARHSVALSSDGNTAIVGGPGDNSQTGAVWIFTRSGGVWSQQGDKLVGVGNSGLTTQQGMSVAISGDGNTAIVGGPANNNNDGAVWIFIRGQLGWSQQGLRLTGDPGSLFGDW